MREDFVVDDDGLGYKDHGGEIWEYSEEEYVVEKPKKKKKDTDIQNYVKPQSTLKQVKKAAKPIPANSKQLMDNLLDNLDDEEEVLDSKPDQFVAFNKNQQLDFKYDQAVGGNRSKRPIEAICQDVKEDTVLEEIEEK